MYYHVPVKTYNTTRWLVCISTRNESFRMVPWGTPYSYIDIFSHISGKVIKRNYAFFFHVWDVDWCQCISVRFQYRLKLKMESNSLAIIFQFGTNFQKWGWYLITVPIFRHFPLFVFTTKISTNQWWFNSCPDLSLQLFCKPPCRSIKNHHRLINANNTGRTTNEIIKSFSYSLMFLFNLCPSTHKHVQPVGQFLLIV